MSSKANNPSPPETMHGSQDADAFTYLVGFFGLFTFATFLFLLLFSPALSSVALGPVFVPSFAVVALTAALALPFMRRFQAFFGSDRGLSITKAAGMACTCIAPMGLLANPLFIPATLIVAFGVMALGFLWSLYMCRFSHIALAKLLSFAIILAAVISGTLLFNEPPPATIFTMMALGAASWLSVLNIKGLTRLDNLSISPEDCVRRAITIRVDRWTYSLIGCDLGFSLGLAHCLMGSSSDEVVTSADIAVFCIPAIAVGIVLLASHTRFENTLESVSKDYLSFAFTLSALSTFCLPGIGKLVGLMLLLAVSFLQVVILINASIEFIRFEELSPQWYMAEEAFVASGIVVGTLLAWTGMFGLPSLDGCFYATCVAILVNTFAQTFINEGRFPSSDQTPLVLESTPREYVTETESAQDVDALRGEVWVKSVNHICQEYNLSPRQSEILKLLANGRDSVYIENHFCISKSTAKSHIYNIYRKLHIHSRQELIDIVERNH